MDWGRLCLKIFIETVLLSTHNICFGWEIWKIFFDYILLSGLVEPWGWYTSFTTCVPMEFPIEFDTVKSGWSIVYIEGSQVIISPKKYMYFSEDWFCQSRVHTDLAKQNSLTFPWLFPDTNLNFPDITVLAEKLGFIQTFVYSYSLQHFVSILSDYFELCKVFIQAFQQRNLQIVTWLYVCLFCFVALRPKSTAMVMAGRSVHLTTLFPGQAWASS